MSACAAIIKRVVNDFKHRTNKTVVLIIEDWEIKGE